MRDNRYGKLNLILILMIAVLVFLNSGMLYASSRVVPSVIADRAVYRTYPLMEYIQLLRPVELTNDYVATDYTEFAGASNIGVFFDIIRGSLTSFEYVAQWSPTNEDWYDEVTESVASTTITDTVCNYTMSLSGNVMFYKIFPYRGNYFRIKVKGTGTGTGSYCNIKVLALY